MKLNSNILYRLIKMGNIFGIPTEIKPLYHKMETVMFSMNEIIRILSDPMGENILTSLVFNNFKGNKIPDDILTPLTKGLSVSDIIENILNEHKNINMNCKVEIVLNYLNELIKINNQLYELLEKKASYCWQTNLALTVPNAPYKKFDIILS